MHENIRFQDFGLETRAKLLEMATYSQVELDAACRAAFAKGEAKGRAEADAAAALALEARDAELARLTQEITRIGADADAQLNQAADTLESIVRIALSKSLPKAADARAPELLEAALHEAFASLPKLSIQLAAHPTTVAAAARLNRENSMGFDLVERSSIKEGHATLTWERGGADFSPRMVAEKIHATVATYLGALRTTESDDAFVEAPLPTTDLDDAPGPSDDLDASDIIPSAAIGDESDE